MKKDRKVLIRFIIVGIVLFITLGIFVYKDFFKGNTKDKKLVSLDLYGYTLSSSDSKLYKKVFKELEKVLNEEKINYEQYAKKISELFVIDVFTLNNKITSTDIGGLEFVHKDLKENFEENLGAGLYRQIESNLDGKRNQELPIVSSVVVDNVFETVYNYNDKTYKAYLVSLSFEYEKDNGYQNKIKLTVINDDNKLFIVKGE